MLHRTHRLNELRLEHVDERVVLQGWVNRRRDHGGVIFLDLRDSEGLTQVVCSPEHNAQAHAVGETVRGEYCLEVVGTVRARSPETVNDKLDTGHIEVMADELTVLNASETPPIFVAGDGEEDEKVRLKYRYLDLRRPQMQRLLKQRHRFLATVRRVLDEEGFLEVETPVLSKSTPEGARDFLVPSRLNPTHFYALPQSPQLFKQLLMVSGVDRYAQIVKCFRDEDLRADRQPEFTQIDMEMSFATPDMVIAIVEKMIATAALEAFGVDLPRPFARRTYQDVMDKYGLDAPDLRFGMELVDLSPVFAETGFQQFRKQLDGGGMIKALKADGGAKFSRKDMDDFTEFVKKFKAKGLAWFVVEGENLKSPVTKFLAQEEIDGMLQRTGAKQGDALFLLCDQPGVVNEGLGRLRLEIGRREGLIQPGFALTWVTDFPLLQYDDEARRFDAVHHPFTMPHPEDMEKLHSEPLAVRSLAYDLVMNGTEIGGGSIRIHRPDLQSTIFDLLKISREDARAKFGFLLDALSYGAPPHGGIAFGVDRLVMLLSGQSSIRETMAFPKTQSGHCLMTDAPSAVSDEQLKEAFIKTLPPPEPPAG